MYIKTMQLVFYLTTFSTPCMDYLLYLMFRCDRRCDGCDGKFGNFVGTKPTLGLGTTRPSTSALCCGADIQNLADLTGMAADMRGRGGAARAHRQTG